MQSNKSSNKSSKSSAKQQKQQQKQQKQQKEREDKLLKGGIYCKMSGYDISEVDFLETLDEQNMNFNVSFDSPPRVLSKFQHLFDCRIHLLVHNTTCFSPGESKYVETNIVIHPYHRRILQTIKNEDLNLMFKEEILLNQTEAYRLSVQLTNINDQNIILPKSLCCGYLLIK